MLSLNINFVLCINCILFFIGLLGIVLNRKNILTIIMSIELLLLAVNLNFELLLEKTLKKVSHKLKFYKTF